MEAVFHAHDSMKKCASSCMNKQYTLALDALNQKFRDKVDSLTQRLIKKKISSKAYADRLMQLATHKLEEMKSMEEITTYYACTIKKCGTEVEQFRKAMVAEIETTIADKKQKLKETTDKTQKKIYNDILAINKRRLAVIKTSLTVPRLITILYS